MDPLSISVGVVGLCSAAAGACKISEKIYRMSRDIKVVGYEIECLAEEVNAYGLLVQIVCIAIDSYVQSNQTSTPALQFLQDKKLLDYLVIQSEQVIRELKNQLSNIRALRRRSVFMASFKWTRRKEEIMGLKLKMESSKSSLSVLMNSIKLEGLRHQPASALRDREIKVFSNQIESLARTIERLQKQLRDQDAENHRGDEYSFISINNNIQVNLISLGLNMAREGNVPGYSPSLMSTRSSISEMSTSSIADHNLASESQSSIAGPSLQSRPHSIAYPTISGPSNPTTKQRRAQGQSVEVAQAMSETDMALYRPERTENQEVPELVGPPPRLPTEGDFVNVHSGSYLLHYNPSHDISSEQGFIITADGPRRATILLDKKLPQNVISQAYAIELGLEIDLEDGDPVTSESNQIDFGDGTVERSLGRATLQWRDGVQPYLKPFSVHCLVYEHGVRNVVFGAPFVTKREHYKEEAKRRA